MGCIIVMEQLSLPASLTTDHGGNSLTDAQTVACCISNIHQH